MPDFEFRISDDVVVTVTNHTAQTEEERRKLGQSIRGSYSGLRPGRYRFDAATGRLLPVS